MDVKQVGIFVGVIVILLVAMYIMVSFSSPEGNFSEMDDEDRELLNIRDDDFVKGNPEASVVIVEYSDFQCPACASYYPLVKFLVEEDLDGIAFTYRYFPLPQFENARLSSRASYAAGNQGRFWEMHDLIFDMQDEWARESDAEELFIGYAEDLDLNIDQFIEDMNSSEANNRINKDLSDASVLGVNSTPTFFVNGEKISNPESYEEFKSIIDNARNE